MQKNQQWKDKVQELFQVCQDELKKTTRIGKKMLSASKTNTNLHEAYEEIGRLAVKSLKENEINWDNPRVEELLSTVATCESELKEIESEVHNIKFSPGPVDVSLKSNTEENVDTKKTSNIETEETTDSKVNEETSTNSEKDSEENNSKKETKQ